nr:MAG TPA: hypothetical protein [Caudoviricetes sp.]
MAFLFKKRHFHYKTLDKCLAICYNERVNCGTATAIVSF